MTEDQIIAAGSRVEAFLADEAVLAAKKKVEDRIIADWRDAKDVQVREKCHARLEVMDSLWAMFRATVGNGQVATAQKDERQKRNRK